MSTGIGCTVRVDGVRLADGSPGDNPNNPTALSGLSVAWGRETVLDQPEPSTCTLSVLDLPGGEAFTGALHTGANLVVTASGTVFPDPTVSTFVDPSFETTAPAWATHGFVAASTRRAHTGARSLRVWPAGADRGVRAFLPPAPLDDVDPAAWDAIPKTTIGQSWSVGASLFAPPGAVVQLLPLTFPDPSGAGYQIVDQTLRVVGDGTWQTVTMPYVPALSDVWVGVMVAVWPHGPAWDDLDPGTSWTELDPSWTWNDYQDTYVDDVAVLAPAAGTARTVGVFAGRISNVEVAFDTDSQAPIVTVTATDFTAGLANRDVGDAPWLVEPMADRFVRVLALAGEDVDTVIDPRPAAVLVSWQDVDATPAADLLRTLATTADAVMWPAVHPSTGAYLRVEDASLRAPLFRLELDPDTGLVVIVTAGGLVLSACDVLSDPVTWVQSSEDVVTRVSVGWLEQTTEDGVPKPTDRTVFVVDPALETTHGAWRLSVSTILQTAADATTLADRILARTDATDWRLDGLTVDDDDTDDPELMFALIDGTRRIGLPVALVDLPAWAPVTDAPVYIEGGELRFDDGRWVAAATAARASGLGVSAAWQDLDPDWSWTEFDPSITWSSLYGVAGPAEE